MTARFIIGDTRDVTATLPDASVDLVLTSPPFLALRSYLPADHPDKRREIGSEATPAEFIDVLLALTAEWGRVLAPHGSIAIELGDTYSGSGGGGGDYSDGGMRDGQPKFDGSGQRVRATRREGFIANGIDPPARRNLSAGWPDAKSLTLIPELYRLALAYGINPLTGQPSPAGRWRVRNVVRWHRPNPPVGALGDKFRPSTSEMVIATRDPKRYFDLDAVRSELSTRKADTSDPRKEPNKQREGTNFNTLGPDDPSQSGGAPPLDTWVIPTHPYKGAHYATWPPDLCVKPIKSMVPERVCTTCGEPSSRITSEPTYVDANGDEVEGKSWPSAIADRSAHAAKTDGSVTRTTRTTRTTGWTDCGHDSWRTGIVLDPFAGSGTTLMVATGHGRDAIGIDIDRRNLDLARERVGMFLEEVIVDGGQGNEGAA